MRTYKDAKAMAKSLRNSLAARSVQPAIRGGDRQEPRNPGPQQVSCSFCGKSKVRSLIEGGCSRDRIGAHLGCLFICDECVAFCAQVNADLIGGATSPENLSALPD